MGTSHKNGLIEVKLGDLFRIKHGFAFKGEFFSDTGDLILLTPGNFEPHGGLKLKGEKEKFYSGDFPKEYLLSKGDLLIVMTDLTQEARILGSPAFIKDDNRFLHNQRLGKVVEVKSDLIDLPFLFYLFNSNQVRGQIKGSATGATVRHTSPERIYAVKATIPTLPIQRRIAAILSAYDDLIENNTRRIRILEEMARRIYEEWFVRFRFPGHENVRMVESELGLIPEGWEVSKVADTFDILGGGTPSTTVEEYWYNGSINWYSPTDLTRNGLVFIDESKDKITPLGLAKSSARMFPAFSVMMTSRATLGVIAINTTEACTNQGFITCIPNERFPLYVLLHWLKQNVELFVSLATGATFKEITKGNFKQVSLLVPPVVLTNVFQNLVEPIMQQLLNLQRKNTNLRRTRNMLLPKLISGEIDVSNFPEPVSD